MKYDFNLVENTLRRESCSSAWEGFLLPGNEDGESGIVHTGKAAHSLPREGVQKSSVSPGLRNTSLGTL